jgi:ABC-type nitrate/sulfonate/bicarbonate transport system substrate-binding protein
MGGVILKLSLAAVIGACASGVGTAASNKPDVLNFSLNWFPLADHAAYYSAAALGYYERENLAVNILQGAGSGTSVRRVDIGQADCHLDHEKDRNYQNQRSGQQNDRGLAGRF